MTRFVLLAATALALAGCNREHDGPSITVNSADGDVLAAVDGKSGSVKFDVPGLKGTVSLPKFDVESGNFSLNGVGLYPGSKIANLSVVDGRGGKDDDGGVKVHFNSPAAAGTVRDWYADRLDRAGYDIQVDGRNLKGRTDEGKPFRLNLDATGPDSATGTIVIG